MVVMRAWRVVIVPCAMGSQSGGAVTARLKEWPGSGRAEPPKDARTRAGTDTCLVNARVPITVSASNGARRIGRATHRPGHRGPGVVPARPGVKHQAGSHAARATSGRNDAAFTAKPAVAARTPPSAEPAVMPSSSAVPARAEALSARSGVTSAGSSACRAGPDLREGFSPARGARRRPRRGGGNRAGVRPAA